MRSESRLCLFLLVMTAFSVQAQLPSLDGPTITRPEVSQDSIVEGKHTPTVETKKPSERKFNYLTWFMECNYLLIPTSLSSGAEIHFEFINRVKKKTAVKPSVGIGGFFFQHKYKQYDFGDYKADVFARRYGGHFTLGARVVHRLGGICLRVGYNAMYIQYEWSNFSNITTPYDNPNRDRLLHRIQFEAVGFKSFTKKKPGVGILAGVQYLLDPTHKNSDLLVVKAGIAF